MRRMRVQVFGVHDVFRGLWGLESRVSSVGDTVDGQNPA